MRIAILAPSITSHDAVSNDVLGMYGALQNAGEVRIFAEGWSLTEPRIFSSSKLESFLKKSDDILIYHFARGWEPALPLLNSLKCRKIIKYHNITPAKFFARYSADFANQCREGRLQLRLIATSDTDLFLSASGYNMRELLAEGAPETKSFALPPFHHIDRLHSIEADAAVLDQFQNGHVNVCTVGRLTPNKGHPQLIAAFAAYHHEYNPRSRLIIVGKHETRLAKYGALLRALIKRLALEHAVTFTGGVSDNALKAFYTIADMFVTTSEHEGFCVPLVEAMALKVPIVAYGSSAIPETVGQAGIVWEQSNPFLMAESINAIASDSSLSAGLAQMGWGRYQDLFTNQRIGSEFLSALRTLS
ncbi:MAG TPA: glycosyltransferase family 4 protein [Pyrinomonadaceae bacterium]|jgi:glycosyltransferase involved in cell wall biosynthesis|nr:glycosyltransferase family 4 protein [Pyrinomonadaceae bacterium]